MVFLPAVAMVNSLNRIKGESDPFVRRPSGLCPNSGGSHLRRTSLRDFSQKRNFIKRTPIKSSRSLPRIDPRVSNKYGSRRGVGKPAATIK